MDPLVSTDWLAERLDDGNLRIVDCRFSFDDPGLGPRVYREAHIPGAVYLDWTRDISEPRDGLLYMAPSADYLRASLEHLGIGGDTTVVGYDDEGGHYVSRLWLIMRSFGLDSVRLLDGGWTKWTAEGRPTRSGDEAPEACRLTSLRPVSSVLVDADEVLRRSDDPKTLLLDVRRLSEFTGEEARSKHGGHIPGAKWMLWQDNLDWDGDRTFRPDAEVRRRYEEAGVTSDKCVITYCHGAVRAAHVALELTRLGYPDVQVYDGSWEEWGSRDDLPIEQGAPRL
ncbi:MAG: sulfurtransferase [Chloroflexi bacterium]|nr:sulfurtransferase [Chloroflexota bacterium]